MSFASLSSIGLLGLIFGFGGSHEELAEAASQEDAMAAFRSSKNP
jgi:hypothetical protein